MKISIKNVEQANGGLLLRNIEFDVLPGHMVIIEGPSGVGKSTLLRHICGIEQYIEKSQNFICGECEISENGAAYDKEGILKNIHYVPHDLDEYFLVSKVYSEIELSLEIREEKEIQEKRRLLLQQAHIAHKSFNKIDELSAGEKVLVAISSALARNPKVLLLDEPCFRLSNKSMRLLISTLESYASTGGRLIVATHQPEKFEDPSIKINKVNRCTLNMEVTSEPLAELGCKSNCTQAVEPLLNLQGFDLRHPNSNEFLFHCNGLKIFTGECILIFGGNGSGKTTFLEYISGLNGMWPDGMEFSGINIDRNKPKYREEISYISDSPLLQISESKVKDIIQKILNETADVNYKNCLQVLAKEILRVFVIKENAHVSDLSNGQQKIVSLFYLGMNSKLVLIDEVVIAKDKRQMDLIISIMTELKKSGTSVIFTSHQASPFENIIDRKFHITNGWMNTEAV